MERVVELREVYAVQKCQHALVRFAQIGRHGGFTVPGDTVVFQLGEDNGCGTARTGCNGKNVAELEGVRTVPQGKLAEFTRGCLHGFGACGSCLQIEGACGNGLQTGVCLPDVSSRAHQRPRFEVAVIWCIRKHTVDAYGAGSVNEFTVPQIQRYMRNVRV